MFLPTLLSLLVYIFTFLIELFSIRKKKLDHTKKDVCNARKWFIYLALPFFNQDYFSGMVYNMTADELKRMYEVYGVRRFNTKLKMYVPFAGSNLDAFKAVHAKNGFFLQLVNDEIGAS